MDLKEINSKLVGKVRLYVYAAALLLILITWFSYSKDSSATTHTANAFGYLAFSFLSLSLAMTPIRTIWPSFGLNPSLHMARKAFGISGFAFALLHYLVQVIVNFKGNLLLPVSLALDGLNGLFAGLFTLIILFILFATSLDFMIKKLGKHWFAIHKLVYLVYPLIIFHAYRLGADFKNGVNLFSGSFLVISAFTIVLEAIRIYLHFNKPRVN